VPWPDATIELVALVRRLIVPPDGCIEFDADLVAPVEHDVERVLRRERRGRLREGDLDVAGLGAGLLCRRHMFLNPVGALIQREGIGFIEKCKSLLSPML